MCSHFSSVSSSGTLKNRGTRFNWRMNNFYFAHSCLFIVYLTPGDCTVSRYLAKNIFDSLIWVLSSVIACLCGLVLPWKTFLWAIVLCLTPGLFLIRNYKSSDSPGLFCLNFISLVCKSVFVPLSYCFYYYNSVIYLEIWGDNISIIVLVFYCYLFCFALLYFCSGSIGLSKIVCSSIRLFG